MTKAANSNVRNKRTTSTQKTDPKKMDALICELSHERQHEGALEVMLPSDERFADIAMAFSIMSDNTRLRIIWLLCQEEYCVYDIANLIGMSAPAISHHLRSLRQLGYIECRRSGKHVLYSIADNKQSNFMRTAITHAFLEWSDQDD